MLSIEKEALLHTSKLQFLVIQLYESLNILSLEFTKHTYSNKTRNMTFCDASSWNYFRWKFLFNVRYDFEHIVVMA